MTLKEIAAIAGVSPAAVSRYLNGGSLSESKRNAIRQAIEETDFRPNRLAHNLRTGHVNQVGVIVPRIHSESASEVLSGIGAVLGEKGYLTVLGSTEGKEFSEEDYLDLMQSYHLAGIIVMSSTVTPEAEERYLSCQIPIVITGQNYANLNCVYHDDFHAMEELTKLVLKQGRTRLAYLGVNESDPAVGVQRRKGMLQAVRNTGLDPSTVCMKISDFSAESGYACMQEVLSELPDVDGVLCATDSIAHGAMLALKDAGKQIPEDVSIAGIGNNLANTISSPRLTTAKLYHVECGRTAAEILLEQIEAEEEHGPARKMMLGYTIQERESIIWGKN